MIIIIISQASCQVQKGKKSIFHTPFWLVSSVALIRRISIMSFLLLCMTLEWVSSVELCSFSFFFPHLDRNFLHFAYLHICVWMENMSSEQSLRVLAYAVYVFFFIHCLFLVWCVRYALHWTIIIFFSYSLALIHLWTAFVVGNCKFKLFGILWT